MPVIMGDMTSSAADRARDTNRDFLQSHPWLTFALDLRAADRRFWQMIGEAHSKCRHLMFAPLKPVVSRDLEMLYLAKGMQATTAIEGNTLTIEQVQAAVEGTLQVPPSQQYLKQEVDNVLDACRAVEDVVDVQGGFEITPAALKDLNARVLRDLQHEDHVEPGAYRTVSVTVGSYRAAPAGDVEFLTKLLCEWLNDDFETSDHRDAFLMAFAKAVVAHVYLAWIHPFGDGNGRTARLLELGILTAAGIPRVAAHLLSNHYNLTRTAYYRQLEHASRSGGDLCPFLAYASEGFVDLLQEELNRVHEEVLQIAWENYVHERFRNRPGNAAKRQRDLVIALGRHGKPVARDQIPTLTPPLALAYASKQAKTVTRDINRILETGLVVRTPLGLRARQDIMLGFMPRVGGEMRKNVLADFSAPDGQPEMPRAIG
jgi:Fic family protein